MSTRVIPLSQIDLPGGGYQAAPYNPTTARRIAESVRAVGLLQPVGVRPVAGTDRFELIFGRHRVGAYRDVLKEEGIEAIVFDSFDDADV
ncbi:MAG: ParB N-terminal domain-containing protein, partial [Planctomycetia bacterium]|nr:ParB N-terminal domain-containing protein [Planctomycetia bacterium]